MDSIQYHTLLLLGFPRCELFCESLLSQECLCEPKHFALRDPRLQELRVQRLLSADLRCCLVEELGHFAIGDVDPVAGGKLVVKLGPDQAVEDYLICLGRGLNTQGCGHHGDLVCQLCVGDTIVANHSC